MNASCMLHVEGGSHRPSGGRLGKAWDGPRLGACGARCGSALPRSGHPLDAPRQRLLSCLPSLGKGRAEVEAIAREMVEAFPPLVNRERETWADLIPEWQINFKLAQRIQGIKGTLELGAEHFEELGREFWMTMYQEGRLWEAE